MNCVYVQNNLILMQRMRVYIVMMKLPIFLSTQIQSFSSHNITNAADDLQVVCLCNVLTFWCGLMIHHLIENWRTRLTWPWFCYAPAVLVLVLGSTNVGTARWFWVISEHPKLIHRHCSLYKKTVLPIEEPRMSRKTSRLLIFHSLQLSTHTVHTFSDGKNWL